MKLAIDIVLIPPKDIINLAIETNQKLEKQNQRIPLHAQKCLPHISLAMAVVEKQNLNSIIKKVEKHSLRLQNQDFALLSIYETKLLSGEIISGWNLSKSKEIQNLHENCMEILKPFSENKFQLNALFNGKFADEITLDFIRNFEKHSAFQNFNPHITIGFGKLKKLPKILHFKAKQIAVFQLGNYCTCQKLWANFEI